MAVPYFNYNHVRIPAGWPEGGYVGFFVLKSGSYVTAIVRMVESQSETKVLIVYCASPLIC